MGRMKLAPSKARILNMSYPILIEHYNIIRLKVSTLSSTQRARIVQRVHYLVGKKKISEEELENSYNILLEKFKNMKDVKEHNDLG